jgi:hypothetical protein
MPAGGAAPDREQRSRRSALSEGGQPLSQSSSVFGLDPHHLVEDAFEGGTVRFGPRRQAAPDRVLGSV